MTAPMSAHILARTMHARAPASSDDVPRHATDTRNEPYVYASACALGWRTHALNSHDGRFTHTRAYTRSDGERTTAIRARRRNMIYSAASVFSVCYYVPSGYLWNGQSRE